MFAFPATTTASPQANDSSSNTLIQETVEVLEAQVNLKKALVRESRAQMEAAKEEARIINLPGVGNRIEQNLARNEWKVSESHVEVKQAELMAASLRLQHARSHAKPEGNRPASDQSLNDTIELLEAQVGIRKAMLKEAQTRMATTGEFQAFMDSVVDGHFDKVKVRWDFKKSEAQVAIRQAELRIAELKVKQKRSNPTPSAAQSLRDTIELLEGEIAVKKAIISESEMGPKSVEEFRTTLRFFHNQDKIGLARLEGELKTNIARVETRQAELKVEEIRLQQAQARLASLTNAPAK